MENYKAADIVERTGISKIQLTHWINNLAIEPIIDDRRRGGVRYFSQQNLAEATICKFLNDIRLPVTIISTILQTISPIVPFV